MARPREAGDDAVRAFFAIGLAGDVRRRAEALRARLAALAGGDAVRWVRPEGLHVTLRFLGGVEAAAVPELLERVGRETRRVAPFRLSLGAPALFPTPRRARVVTLEAGPEPDLRGLAGAVERGVVAAGLPAEERRFRPHLTLGRVRRGARLSLEFVAGMTGPDTPASDAMDVTEAILFRSELTRGGSIYTSIGRAPLGGASDPASPPKP
ncbi:MAG: RNA 2',3'-cyclic phosphodiesterase [Myxococcota bacterium]